MNRTADAIIIDDPTFWEDAGEKLEGAIFTPQSGYVNDPHLANCNVFRAAQAQGGESLFNSEVVVIRTADGRVQGVTLKGGEEIDAPVVVNVAGPHSSVINRMAGVEEGMKIKTRALRHEVHHVPSPPGFYMVVGTSGNQFKNAGIAGLMMAELIDACENGRDHDADPVRVTGPYTGLTLNAGFYSRLRELNPDSPFTVRG